MANQYSPWQEAGMAFQSMGDSANRTMLGLAQLKHQQQQAMQEQAYRQQQLAIMQAYRQSEEQRMQQQATSQQLKDTQSMQSQQNAQQVGQAGMLSSALMTPSLANNQQTLQDSVGMLRQQGVLPNDAITVSRGDLANLLRTVQTALTQREAVGTPASAASMLTPSNVPRGGTAVDRFGNVVGMGQAPAPDMPFTFNTEGTGNRETGQFQPYPTSVLNALRQKSQGIPSYHPSSIQGVPPMVFDPRTLTMYPLETQEGTNNIPPRFGAPIRAPGSLAPSTGVAQPKSQEEYDGLPSGSVYIDSDGQTKRKK
jgi:hypothetical protein